MKASGTCAAIVAAVFLAACANTPYRDIAVERLSDSQLVDELAAAAAGVGQQINKAQFLIATTPDSLYVLSSSTTTYFGTNSVAASGYVMPTSYGAYISASGAGTYSGTAQTRYYYTDINATAQTLHVLGAAIAEANAAAYRRRGLAVLAEMRRRMEAKRAAAQQSIDAFFAQNPPLAADKGL